MSEPEPGRPGSILRAEREALGVTVREVSETLNLSIPIIEAIEADDYQRLPGPVFARGYVRAYARLLELEPEPLLARYPRAPEVALTRTATAEPPVWEWIRRRPVLVLGAAAGVALLLVVLLVVWLWPDGAGSDDVAGIAESAVPQGVEPFVADVWQNPAEPARPAESMPTAQGSADRPTGAGSDTAGTVDVGAGNIRRITDTGDDRLAFTFTDDCWVEVQNATGAGLYSDLGRGGTELVLMGQGPFRILLGYAPGVQLAFNGEPMPLAPHTRNNVATLVLGQ